MSQIKIIDAKGALSISEDVIAKVVANATREVSGVKDISTDRRLSPASIIRFFFINDQRVVFKNANGILEITVCVILEKAASASKVAKQIQENVKNCVQSMTGLVVSTVNVKICGA